jgi:hypothetical protein
MAGSRVVGLRSISGLDRLSWLVGLRRERNRSPASDSTRDGKPESQRITEDLAIRPAQGNQAKAARWLGVIRLKIREKLKELGLRTTAEDSTNPQ